MRARCGFVLALASLLLAMASPSRAAATAAAPAARVVLVLYSNGRTLPANLAVDRGLREAIDAGPGPQVTVLEEYFDEPRFSGDRYEEAIAAFLRAKYAAQPPAVIVAGGLEALRFLLRQRETLFPGVPIVHEGVPRHVFPSLPPLPADVIGRPHEFDVSSTLDLALQLHPFARRVVVVTGTSLQHDLAWQAPMRAQRERLAARVSFEFLAGLPHDAVLDRLARLGDDAIVVTPGYFQDGAGGLFTPAGSVRDMTRVSAAPVYVTYDTLIGTGAVGGYMRTYRTIGREAGDLVDALLAGANPATLRMLTAAPPSIHLDWRQVQRWDIDPARIPAAAQFSYRTPTIWEAYREYVLLGLVVVLLEGVLIAGLLTERHRRRRAEQAVAIKRTELAHASRLATAGELTAAIAHEINQPLGAILSNADAAEMMLQSGGDRREELREILGDIRRDNLRASEVIRRLRTLLARREVERRPLDVHQVTADAVASVRGEARRQRIALESNRADRPATVEGDAIQLQQVLINLMLNGMDAMADQPPERRVLTVSIKDHGDRICAEVRDRGHGIAPEHLPRLFDSFFTTKRQGMGLGLSIVRTIVESQHGEVTAANLPDGGAVFRVWLPAIAPAPALAPAAAPAAPTDAVPTGPAPAIAASMTYSSLTTQAST